MKQRIITAVILALILVPCVLMGGIAFDILAFCVALGMSYELIKLSEVEKVSSSTSANLLIEENGEIKRLSAKNLTNAQPQVQADWNETDDTKPSYIANKPTNLNVNVLTYFTGSGYLTLDGVPQSREMIKEAWESGADMRIRLNFGDQVIEDASIVGISYSGYSGYCDVYYYNIFNHQMEYHRC